MNQPCIPSLPPDWADMLHSWCQQAITERPEGSRSELCAIVAERAYRLGLEHSGASVAPADVQAEQMDPTDRAVLTLELLADGASIPPEAIALVRDQLKATKEAAQ